MSSNEGVPDWNSAEHTRRVNPATSRYAEEVRTIMAPAIATQVEGYFTEGTEHTVHDLGGYNGLVLEELRSRHLSDSWRGVITDVTRPEEMVDTDATFHQAAGWDIALPLGESSVDLTISTNVFHLMDNSQLARTAKAIKVTSRSRGLFVAIVPHPLVNGRIWSDYKGKEDQQGPEFTSHRGVFIDNYRPDVTVEHLFIPGATTHPRTIESYVTIFLEEGFALRGIATLHRDGARVRDRLGDRHASTLDRLPSWLMTAWITPEKSNKDHK